MRAGAMYGYWWLIAGLLFGFPCQAAVVKVTAEYKPAVYEADNGTFVSTTKCVKTSEGMWLSSCSGGVMSLDSLLFSLKTKVKRNVKKDFSNTRDSFVSLSSLGNKTMIITSDKGQQFSVLFKPDKLGVHFDSVVNPNDGWKIYNTAFTNPKGGCRYLEREVAGYINLTSWIVLWGDVGGKSCYTGLSVDGTSDIQAMFLGFEITPPSPLKMSNGIYTGSIILSVGQNKDIDLGNGVYEDNQLIIELTLKVQHQIKVEFPPGGDKVVLQPPGGWHDWIYRGKARTPPYLIAELPYRLWSSSDFNVWLNCQYAIGEVCMLNNERLGMQVRLDVIYVNKSKEEIPLKHGVKKLFSASLRGPYFINEERSIIFKVQEPVLALMMEYPGSTYKGNVTLIYDAAI
ncbi:TPA: hypothetical protein ACGD2I_002124 [Aeromonas hydrophila]|uniref:hypothetical protein n=1 Tax=Aeromonas hydrophila TaxID=644 RepID=UPI000FD15971|nr:hypothetical protein [Aeromonas hydrophila]AZU47395.1 hypothetical protein C3B79_1617 [Aeromonas hydrophila]MCV3293237.1 hypothetical protein [Aeromonas hydrophila]QBX72712.1 hypothetical protein E4625_18945 [Aeromonas hydrophila]QBX77413.1 hypothetical protein E4630_18720 [Aeromonas hydrophila]